MVHMTKSAESCRRRLKRELAKRKAECAPLEPMIGRFLRQWYVTATHRRACKTHRIELMEIQKLWETGDISRTELQTKVKQIVKLGKKQSKAQRKLSCEETKKHLPCIEEGAMKPKDILTYSFVSGYKDSKLQKWLDWSILTKLDGPILKVFILPRLRPFLAPGDNDVGTDNFDFLFGKPLYNRIQNHSSFDAFIYLYELNFPTARESKDFHLELLGIIDALKVILSKEDQQHCTKLLTDLAKKSGSIMHLKASTLSLARHIKELGTQRLSQLPSLLGEVAVIHRETTLLSKYAGRKLAVLQRKFRDQRVDQTIELAVAPFIQSSPSETSVSEEPNAKEAKAVGTESFTKQEPTHYQHFAASATTSSSIYHGSQENRWNPATNVTMQALRTKTKHVVNPWQPNEYSGYYMVAPFEIRDHMVKPVMLVLSDEIKEFVQMLSGQVAKKAKVRQDLIYRLKRVLGGVFPCAKLVLFGSCANQLELPGSDVDCFYIHQGGEKGLKTCEENIAQMQQMEGAPKSGYGAEHTASNTKVEAVGPHDSVRAFCAVLVDKMINDLLHPPTFVTLGESDHYASVSKQHRLQIDTTAASKRHENRTQGYPFLGAYIPGSGYIPGNGQHRSPPVLSGTYHSSPRQVYPMRPYVPTGHSAQHVSVPVLPPYVHPPAHIDQAKLYGYASLPAWNAQYPMSNRSTVMSTWNNTSGEKSPMSRQRNSQFPSQRHLEYTGLLRCNLAQPILSQLTMLQNALYRESWVKKVHLVRSKIPVIRLHVCQCQDFNRDHLCGLCFTIDISSGHSPGHTRYSAVNFINQYQERYPAFRTLMLLLKKILMAAKLNDPFTGGLGSFPLACMLIAFLKHLSITSSVGSGTGFAEPEPEVNNGVPTTYHRHMKVSPTLWAVHHVTSQQDVATSARFGHRRDIMSSSVGELFFKFLNVYGNWFDCATMGISVNGIQQHGTVSCYYPLPTTGHYAPIVIDNPFWPSKNVASGCYNIQQVLKVFRSYHAKLQQQVSEYSRHGSRGGILRNVLSFKWGQLSKVLLYEDMTREMRQLR